MKMKTNILKIIFCFFSFASLGQSQYMMHLLHEGDNFMAQAEFDLALNSYNSYIENNPNDPRGYLHRARLNEAIGNISASKFDFTVAEKLNPLSHMYFDPSLRSQYYAEKFFDYDISDPDKSFSKSPLRAKDYVEFIHSVQSMHSSDSLIIEVIQDIADQNFVDAEFKLEKIDSNKSNLPLIHDLKGLIELKTGDAEAALDHFTQAIDLAPNFAIAYHNRAICHKLLRQYDKAKEDLEKAISINDELPMFHFAFAKLNQKVGNLDMARKYYKKAIDNDETYIEASTNYSQLLKKIGDYDASLLYLSQADSHDIETSEENYLKANLHFVYGEYEEAKYHFTEYLAEFPEDRDALYNLGLTKLLLREYEEGCECLSRSLYENENQKREEIYNAYCSNSF